MLRADVRSPSVDSQACEIPSQWEKLATEAAVKAKFRQSPHWDFSGVTCHFFEGVLTLRGQVRSYYVKQMAQELVRPMPAVEQIDNRLQVVSSGISG
jgi:osmotically-inducible protein OsmY